MEMITKNIQIDFADQTKQAYDAIPDLRNAVKSASSNLILRHNVVLGYPMPCNGKVVMEIRIPKDSVEDGFPIGQHLRAIATYLMKKCNGRYDNYAVGNRLLVYTEIPKPIQEEEVITSFDRLESISELAKLLQRNDDKATEKIKRIIEILQED